MKEVEYVTVGRLFLLSSFMSRVEAKTKEKSVDCMVCKPDCMCSIYWFCKVKLVLLVVLFRVKCIIKQGMHVCIFKWYLCVFSGYVLV